MEAGAEFGHVVAHGARRDLQEGGDVVVATALHEEGEHELLPVGEAGDGPHALLHEDLGGVDGGAVAHAVEVEVAVSAGGGIGDVEVRKAQAVSCETEEEARPLFFSEEHAAREVCMQLVAGDDEARRGGEAVEGIGLFAEAEGRREVLHGMEAGPESGLVAFQDVVGAVWPDEGKMGAFGVLEEFRQGGGLLVPAVDEAAGEVFRFPAKGECIHVSPLFLRAAVGRQR